MELRDYWAIIRRRWWLPVLLALLALVLSTVVALRGAAAYKTEMRLAVTTRPTVAPPTALYYDPVYYANLSSEYLADDLSEIIRSEAFAADVSAFMQAPVDPSTLADVTRARKTHRLIDVTISTPTAEQGRAIGEAMVQVLNNPSRVGAYLAAMEAYNGRVAIVNEPTTVRGYSTTGLALEVGLRTLVGLFLGVALAFLLDYLDPTVRSRREAEEVLELPVLAQVPGRRGVVA